MKRPCTAFAFLVIVLIVPVLATAQAANPEQELRQLHHRFIEALRSTDIATLDKVFADDLTFYRYDGMVVDKAFLMKNFKTGNTAKDAIEVLGVKTRVFGQSGVGVITDLERITGVLNGKPYSGQMRNIYVCVHRGGNWQVVMRQMTAVAPAVTEADKLSAK